MTYGVLVVDHQSGEVIAVAHASPEIGVGMDLSDRFVGASLLRLALVTWGDREATLFGDQEPFEEDTDGDGRP